VFGTYCKPERDAYPTTGLHDGEDLNGLARASLAPFKAWKRQIGGRFAARSEARRIAP
jgi:hypothetical protein